MQNKCSDFLCLVNYLTVLVFLLLVVFGSNSIQGQDFPFALEKKSELSPRNRGDFERLVKKYKDSICFDKVVPPCVIQEASALQARDALIFATLSQTDMNFTKYQRKSRYKKAIFETLMDFLKLGADTAAVISNGARSKTIISAGSGLVQLFRGSVEKNLRLAEAQILFNKMEANRSKILTIILPKLIGKNRQGIGAYPFESAWIDIVAYYRAGTIDSALSDLAGDTGSEKKAAEDEVKMIKTQDFVSTEQVNKDKEIQNELVIIETNVRKPAASEENIKVTTRLQKIYLALQQSRKFNTILEQLKTEAAALTPSQINADDGRDKRFKEAFDKLNTQPLHNLDAVTLYRVLGKVFEKADDLELSGDLADILQKNK